MPTLESEHVPVQESGQANTLAVLREQAVTPEDHAVIDAEERALRNDNDQALSELYELAGDDPEQIAILDAERARATMQKRLATTPIPRLAVSETGVVLTDEEAAKPKDGEADEYGQGGTRA